MSLTEESKTLLKDWLGLHNYEFENGIIKGVLPENWYLDYCELRATTPFIEEILDKVLESEYASMQLLEINGIGKSDKAIAFRCKVPKNVCPYGMPYITICTLNGGKPTDSNRIIEWEDIESIFVRAKLEEK
jgi:hypothetical protein